jgi:hypothetical protein
MSAALGRVHGDLADSLAYLTSPARIDAEIAYYERAIAAGDRSPETAALLADWRAVREAQRRLLGQAGGAGG